MSRKKTKKDTYVDYDEEYEDDYDYEYDDDEYEDDDEGRGHSKALIVLTCILGAALLAIVGFIGYGIYSQKHMQSVIAPYVGTNVILPNVSVEGIPVGGMTKDEAEATLRAAGTLDVTHTITVHLPDRDLSFTTQLNDFDTDLEAVLEEACAYGHETGTLDGLYAAVQNAEENGKDFTFSTASSYDEQQIRNTVEGVAAEVYVAPVETTVNTDYDSLCVDVIVGTPGTYLDSDTLVNAIMNQFDLGIYDDITFEYASQPIEGVSPSDIISAAVRDPVNAAYDSDTESVSESELGYGTNITAADLQSSLDTATPGQIITIPLYSIEPEIDTETMEGRLFRDVLYSYGSTYTSNSNRTTNLRLCCEKLDGHVVNPGETFSFNDVVGERTAEGGYKDAIVYVDGNSESQVGGGICQVASTMYYCCLYAELQVDQREPHTYVVSYVPGGMDCAIYWDLCDLKWTNNTDYPIKIEAYLSSGRCYIKLIGTDMENHIVKMTSTKLSGTDTPQYQVTRTVYDSNYNLLKEEDLGISYYSNGHG